MKQLERSPGDEEDGGMCEQQGGVPWGEWRVPAALGWGKRLRQGQNSGTSGLFCLSRVTWELFTGFLAGSHAITSSRWQNLVQGLAYDHHVSPLGLIKSFVSSHTQALKIVLCHLFYGGRAKPWWESRGQREEKPFGQFCIVCATRRDGRGRWIMWNGGWHKRHLYLALNWVVWWLAAGAAALPS